MISKYHALIMAGGKGERFWPWSREKRPKQLLPLFGKETMIEMTVKRLLPLIPKQQIWIITNASQARQMSRLMPWLPKTNFIVEPVGRDSAGAVMLGCATIAAKDPDATMALLPADALIKNTKSYLRTLNSCLETAASQKVLMTIGIKPHHASCAYGYIERDLPLKNLRLRSAKTFSVRRFLEKPDLKTAQRLIRSKRYYWNAGMFVWSASAILEALQLHAPHHAKGWFALQKNRSKYLGKNFHLLPKISIDYAVMEKARNICVTEGDFDWDDVGSWSAICDHLPTDKNGNCSRGKVFTVDSQNCLILGHHKPIATLGLKDLMVIQTEDATLICHRNHAQRVKEIVKQLPAHLR